MSMDSPGERARVNVLANDDEIFVPPPQSQWFSLPWIVYQGSVRRWRPHLVVVTITFFFSIESVIFFFFSLIGWRDPYEPHLDDSEHGEEKASSLFKKRSQMYRIFLPIASASANNKVPHSVKYIYKKVLLLSSFFYFFRCPTLLSRVLEYTFFCSCRRRRSRSRFWSLLFRKDTFLFLLSSPCWLYLFRVLAEVFQPWKPIVAHRSLCCCAWMQNLRRLLFASHTPVFFREAIWRWVFLSFVGWNLSGGNFISNVEKSSSNQVAHWLKGNEAIIEFPSALCLHQASIFIKWESVEIHDEELEGDISLHKIDFWEVIAIPTTIVDHENNNTVAGYDLYLLNTSYLKYFTFENPEDSQSNFSQRPRFVTV